MLSRSAGGPALAQHLSALESRGLKWATETFPYFRDTAQLPKGVGVGTLDKLVALGLAEREETDPPHRQDRLPDHAAGLAHHVRHDL